MSAPKLASRAAGLGIADYLVGRLENLLAEWRTSVRTLSDGDLGAERESLRQRCEGQLGPSPAAVLLRMFDAEVARRGEGRGA